MTFPTYLKDKILDIHGHFIRKHTDRRGGGGKSSNNSSKHSSMSSSEGSAINNISISTEEEIGKTLFPQSKLRIAFQKSIADKKANWHNRMILIIIFASIITILLNVFNRVSYIQKYDYTGDVMERIEKLNRMGTSLFTTSFSILFHWAQIEGKLLNEDYEADLVSHDGDIQPYIPSNLSWKENAKRFENMARDYFFNFSSQIAEYAETNADVYEYAKPFFDNSSSFAICHNHEVVEFLHTDFLRTFSNLFFHQDYMGAIEDSNYWESDSFCTIISTLSSDFTIFTNFEEIMEKEYTTEMNRVASIIKVLVFAIPGGYFLIAFIILQTGLICYRKEIIGLLKHMYNFPIEVKQAASQELAENDKDKTSIQTTQVALHTDRSFIFNVILVLLILIIAIGYFIYYYYVNNFHHYFLWIVNWSIHSRNRKSLVLEALLWTSATVFLYDNNNISYINDSYSKELAKEALDLLVEETSKLTQRDGIRPQPFGYHSKLDELLLSSTCQQNISDKSLHEKYRCSSIEQKLSLFSDLVNEVLVKYANYQNKINHTNTNEIIHIANYHLIPSLLELDQEFNFFLSEYLSKYRSQLSIIYLIVYVLLGITIILFFVYLNFLKRCYDMCLTMLRTINPIAIVNNSELLNYLLDKSSTSSLAQMSRDQSILHNANDCIFSLSLNGVIETLNPSVTKTFGYTPEQLLGQSILSLISEDQKSTLENQLVLMKNRQSALTYSDSVVCITDTESTIPCSLTVFGIVDNQNNLQSFVVILRDNSVLASQQLEAEKAKKQSETLLFQILPRNIVTRLNQGEKDISFTVPSATIMFIDIVKFSEYASRLTPQEIMGNLSMIFAAFDSHIENFPMLLKIKLIGDVYMCAGGLFNPDDPPEKHAEQMVRFGLEALQVLEEINIKLNILLSIRIGVNTGGPLIAGVLGTDKPIFDIIGDPINIAARLQSTDLPGSIQISQNTYDLIKDKEFDISNDDLPF